jgi:polyhydroxybutyrate depolymerase
MRTGTIVAACWACATGCRQDGCRIACSGSVDLASAVVEAGGPEAAWRAPSRSRGCGQAVDDVSPRAVAIDVGGAQRSYYLALPANYDRHRAHALVFGFHGSGANGEVLRSSFDVEAQAGGEAIFVYPDGLDVGGMTGWLLKPNQRDIALIDAVRSDLERKYCVDSGAVFAFGFSYGGYMANALACARPGLLRGVASIGGGDPDGRCDGRVAAMIIHGGGDFDVPLDSGEASRDHWLRASGCRRKAMPTSPSPCVTYEGCAPGAPVVWCRHDGGHVIPDFAAVAVGAFFSSLR